jgi:LysM repeat protein
MEYVIRRGDTLASIAGAHRTTVDALVQLNGISNRNLILAGAVLNVPNPERAP